MKVCEVPLSVNLLSQSNIEPILMTSIASVGLVATLILAFRFLRKPGVWRTHQKSAAWYAVIVTIQAFVVAAIGPTITPLHTGVARRTLEQTCGISDMHTNDGVFTWLENLKYPYLGGETRYGPLWFTRNGKITSGGVTLKDGIATVYSGDYDANITVNISDAGSTMLTYLVLVVTVAILMFVVAYTLMCQKKPMENEPLMVFVTWLCVFIAAIMTGVSLPVIDERWFAVTTVVMLLENVVAFASPFWLLHRLTSNNHETRQ